MSFTGRALVATRGSVREENLAHGTVNMQKCKTCGNKVKENQEFCSSCGKSLVEQVKCDNCGEMIEANAKHCSKCGKELN